MGRDDRMAGNATAVSASGWDRGDSAGLCPA